MIKQVSEPQPPYSILRLMTCPFNPKIGKGRQGIKSNPGGLSLYSSIRKGAGVELDSLKNQAAKGKSECVFCHTQY